MRKERNRNSVYNACLEEGSFLPVAKVDYEQIRAMLKVALTDFDSVKQWEKQTQIDSGQWNAIYKLAYDVLHALAEAFLLLEKVKARTHECVFAHICEKHPEFEFDWNFFEKVRSKRNRSIYYGEPANYNSWNEIELQIKLYINTLKKAIEESLN